jgi:hypothetical protein
VHREDTAQVGGLTGGAYDDREEVVYNDEPNLAMVRMIKNKIK